jgi:BirA family biotin operon repressor/biotin-[acetyl-CoA-carboxylase] ligase
MGGQHARPRLAGTRFHDVRWVEETGSTNRDLLELAASGAPEGVVLVADHQTAGRGRLDRTWVAPPGSSLLLSVLLRPGTAPPHLLTTATALAALTAARRVAGVEARLKWPNDLVVDGPAGAQKLAGILAESTVDGGRVTGVVVGIGLNVNWPDELPPDLEGTAVALNHLVGHEVDCEELLDELLVDLDRWCDRLDDRDAAGDLVVVAEARARSATLGHHVRVDLGGEVVTGRAVALTDGGELVVETAAGPRTVVAGDVIHVRARD